MYVICFLMYIVILCDSVPIRPIQWQPCLCSWCRDGSSDSLQTDSLPRKFPGSSHRGRWARRTGPSSGRNLTASGQGVLSLPLRPVVAAERLVHMHIVFKKTTALPDHSNILYTIRRSCVCTSPISEFLFAFICRRNLGHPRTVAHRLSNCLKYKYRVM